MTTTNDQWLPLGLEDDEVEAYAALRDDIPPWLEPSISDWIGDRFTTERSSMYPGFNSKLARKCERTLRVTIRDDGPHAHAVGMQALTRFMSEQSVRGLWRFVDFLLSELWRNSDEVTKLHSYLLDAGSAWEVGDRQGKPGLVRRVPEGVKAAAEAAFKKPNAGKRLATAWEDAFGVDPNPSKAYWFAVKAVEDAASPIVIPNDPGPTLGKVISRVEQGGQFNLPHLREDSRAVTHDVLLGMLRMLWVGQYDRHGGLPASPLPDSVTQPEAESAVMLAVTLVGWFEGGHVQ